jgi:hypothetical protein
MDVLEKMSYFHYLTVGCGYMDIKEIPRKRYAAIERLLFTHSIVIGVIGDTSLSDRYCYHTYEAAKKALDAWSGIGDPDGWHRNPGTGRRRKGGTKETEYVDW